MGDDARIRNHAVIGQLSDLLPDWAGEGGVRDDNSMSCQIYFRIGQVGQQRHPLTVDTCTDKQPTYRLDAIDLTQGKRQF